MNKPLYVSISGTVLSYIVFENSKCRYKQEGFLLGEIIHRESKSITDNDQEQINISKMIKITSVMPCPHPYYFHKAYGPVDAAKIKDFLGDQFSSVVAWYKYNPVSTTQFRLTLRDRLIHRQLQSIFEVPPDLFTVGIFISEASANQSTHTHSQLFMRHNSATNVWDKLPMHVPNLSDDDSAYQSAEPVSETFKKIVESLNIDTKNTQGAIVANEIQTALQQHTESLISKVAAAEKRLFELEQAFEESRRKKCDSENTNEDVVTDLDDVATEEGAGGDTNLIEQVEKKGRGRPKKCTDEINNVNNSPRKRKN